MLAIRLLLFALIFSPLMDARELSLNLYAEGAVLINAQTGAVLFSKSCDEKLYPASITKIATALYALKKKEGHLDEVVVAKKEAIASITPEAKRQSNFRAPPYWLETDGTHVGIKKGEEFILRDLLYVMLIASANDAANVIAEHVGGTIPKFMEGLNSYVKELGCKNTNFLNPHGLHHPDQVSSARDMAIITAEAMKHPLFRKIVSTVRYNVPKTNLEFERAIVQTNLLLRKGKYYYPQAIGVKTGTTSAAGKALVAAATVEGRELIAVVMGCQKIGERYEDAIKMFDAAFHQQKMRRQVLPKGSSSLKKKVLGAKGVLKTELPLGLYYDFFPAEECAVKATVKWMIPKLPIEKGKQVGVVRIVDRAGRILQENPILASEGLTPSFFYKINAIFDRGALGRKIAFGVILVTLFFIIVKVSKRRRRKYS